MSRDAVKKAIDAIIEEMRAMKYGVVNDEKFQLGMVAGMLRAYWAVGAITESERMQIHDEIFEEYFNE